MNTPSPLSFIAKTLCLYVVTAIAGPTLTAKAAEISAAQVAPRPAMRLAMQSKLNQQRDMAKAAPQDPSLISVSAVGDMMLGTDYPGDTLPPRDGLRIFEDSAAYIQAADIRFGNLEGTLYDGQPDRDAKRGGANRYLFRSPTRFGLRFQEAGFNVVSLANNHSKDLGTTGFESTKRTLEALGIQYSSKTGEVAEFNVRGKTVAVIAADYYEGNRSITKTEAIYAEIAELSARYDILIVSAHAGAEGKHSTELTFRDEVYLGENRGNPVDFARKAVRLGADLIVMHGPHVPRAMEVFEKRLIIYSLGNFATMQGMSVSGANGYSPLARVQLRSNGEFAGGHLASFEQQRPDRVKYDPQMKAMVMVRTLSERQFPDSAPMIDAQGFITERPSVATQPLR